MPRRLASSWGRAAAVLAVAAFALTARAQDATPPDPAGAEAVAVAYMDAIGAGDWLAAGQTIDPDELVAMGEILSFIAEQDSTGEAAKGLGLQGSAEGAEAFAQFMEAVAGMNPVMEDAFRTLRYDVLGSVAEGDSLTHVLYRSTTTMFGMEIQSVAVISARWLGDRWAVVLDEQMRGMTRAFEQMSEAFSDLDEEDWDDDGDGSEGAWDDDGMDEEDGSDG